MRRTVALSVFIVALLSYSVLITVNICMTASVVDFVEGVYDYPEGTIAYYVAIPREGLKKTVAIMFPAFMEWKEQFKQISFELAKLGVPSVAFDLIGHGGTSLPFNVSFSYGEPYDLVISRIINYTTRLYEPVIRYVIYSLFGSENVSTIYMGHGTGASIATSLSMSDKRTVATIVVSPTGFTEKMLSRFNSSFPRNLLIIVGSFDYEERKDMISEIMSRSGYNSFEFERDYGSFENGSARRVVIVPYSTDIINYYHGATISNIIYWVAHVLDITVSYIPISVVKLYFYIFAIIAGFVAISVFPIVFRYEVGLISGGKRWPHPELKRKALIYTLIWVFTSVFFIPISAILLIIFSKYIVIPAFLSVLIGYDVVSILVSLFLASKWSGIKMKDVFYDSVIEIYKSPRGLLLGIEIGIFSFILIILVVQDLMVSLTNLIYRPVLIIAIILAMIFHFASNLTYEEFFRRYIQESFGGVTMYAVSITVGFSMLARLLLVFVFGLVFTILSGLPFFSILVVLVLIVIVFYMETISAVSYYATRETTPASIANTILVIFLILISPTVYFERLVFTIISV